MSKNIKAYTDKWQMICRQGPEGLEMARSAMYTCSLLYCRFFKGPGKQPQSMLECLHIMNAVWDENKHRVVEHPNSDESHRTDRLAAQVFACIPWVKKQYPKLSWKLRKRGAISVLLRSLAIAPIFYPLLLLLDCLTLINFDTSEADIVRAHYEMRRWPTPISYIRGLVKMIRLSTISKRMALDSTRPPIEDYLKNLKK